MLEILDEGVGRATLVQHFPGIFSNKQRGPCSIVVLTEGSSVWNREWTENRTYERICKPAEHLPVGYITILSAFEAASRSM